MNNVFLIRSKGFAPQHSVPKTGDFEPLKFQKEFFPRRLGNFVYLVGQWLTLNRVEIPRMCRTLFGD